MIMVYKPVWYIRYFSQKRDYIITNKKFFGSFCITNLTKAARRNILIIYKQHYGQPGKRVK